MSAARVERRLAAILAADVAGYSRLIGADEEGTLARLKAMPKQFPNTKLRLRSIATWLGRWPTLVDSKSMSAP